MHVPKEIQNQIFSDGIENFSNMYIEKLEKKESYTVEDIRNAFAEGAKWMYGFRDVYEMLKPRM